MSRIYQQRARILVIDNSEINREMLNDILGEIYEIKLAGSGREALEILEKEHWNLELVLLKLEMRTLMDTNSSGLWERRSGWMSLL